MVDAGVAVVLFPTGLPAQVLRMDGAGDMVRLKTEAVARAEVEELVG